MYPDALPYTSGTVCRFDPPIQTPAQRYLRGRAFGDWSFRTFAFGVFVDLTDSVPQSLIFIGRAAEDRKQYQFKVLKPSAYQNEELVHRTKQQVTTVTPVRSNGNV